MSIVIDRDVRAYADRVCEQANRLYGLHKKYKTEVEFDSAPVGEQRKYVSAFLSVVAMCDEGFPNTIQKYFRRPWYKGVKSLADRLSADDNIHLYRVTYQTCDRILEKMLDVFSEVKTWPVK